MKEILRKLVHSLRRLFSDTNAVNEKSVIGFLAFAMMVGVLLLDMVTGLMQKEFPIHEFVYDGFLYIAIGALGIASVDKIFRKTDTNESEFPNFDDRMEKKNDECDCSDECNCNRN